MDILADIPANAAIWDYIPGLFCDDASSVISNKSRSPGNTSPQGLSSNTFLTYYDILPDKSVKLSRCSRLEFWHKVLQAANMMITCGLRKKSRQIHYFSGNKVEDLILRTATMLVGSIPVTVNWQADSFEQICYKIQVTEATVAFIDSKTAWVNELKAKFPDLKIIDAHNEIEQTEQISSATWSKFTATNPPPELHDIRCIIFTSGTTGKYAHFREIFSACTSLIS